MLQHEVPLGSLTSKTDLQLTKPQSWNIVTLKIWRDERIFTPLSRAFLGHDRAVEYREIKLKYN
jgi:hypothetical protein